MYLCRGEDIKKSGCLHPNRHKKNDYFAELQGRIQIDANDAYALLTQGNLNLRTYYKQTKPKVVFFHYLAQIAVCTHMHTLACPV